MKIGNNPLKFYCRFCKKWKNWSEFHYGTPKEKIPNACMKCVREGKVKRKFLVKR